MISRVRTILEQRAQTERKMISDAEAVAQRAKARLAIVEAELALPEPANLSRSGTWWTSDREIYVAEMSNEHLANSIRLTARKLCENRASVNELQKRMSRQTDALLRLCGEAGLRDLSID